MSSVPLAKKGFSFEELLVKLLPLIGTVALIGSVLARFFLRKHESVRDPVGSVCDAIFIAAFLAYVVDPVLKQKLMREGGKTIFRYLYGYDLPPALQDYYRNSVIKTTDLRTNCVLHFKIEPIPSVLDQVAINVHATFTILNFTNQTHNYQHTVFAISDTPKAEGRVEALYCEDLDQEKVEYAYTAEELDKQVSPSSGNGEKLKAEYRYGRDVSIEPNDNGRYRFGVKYSARATWPHGLDWFYFTEVTTDAEVILTVPESLQHHHFSITPASSVGVTDSIPATHDRITNEYRCRWKYNRLFVPNEILIIRWQPPLEGVSETFSMTGDPVSTPFEQSPSVSGIQTR